MVGGATVVAALLPVDWVAAPGAIARALDAHAPRAAVLLGQSSRPEITPERVGINVQNGVDNAGRERVDQPVVPRGPDAYLSALPLRAMVQAVRAAGVPASVSDTAGTYLCNTVAYLVRHLLPEQVASPAGRGAAPLPSMALEVQLRGVRAALSAVAAGLGLPERRPA